jgi:hypothetical protein
MKYGSKLILEGVEGEGGGIEDGGRDPGYHSEPVFLNVYGAQESTPRHQFRQPM